MTMAKPAKADHRQLRGNETRQLLMRAAEKLIAEKGLEQVTVREILDEADQNNMSALQYHFGNKRGLIEAILGKRAEEVQQKRAKLMGVLLSESGTPELRQLCEMMIRPSFELARASVEFRRHIQAFGRLLSLVEDSAAEEVFAWGGGGESGVELARLLRQALPQLSNETFRQRMDFAVRLCASTLSTHSNTRQAFRGAKSDFFIEGLVDALVGLLAAPESAQLKRDS